jgi:hypothetical protein
MKPLIDEAYAYYDSAKRFTAIGDCQRVRTIEQAMATGFAAAVNIR